MERLYFHSQREGMTLREEETLWVAENLPGSASRLYQR